MDANSGSRSRRFAGWCAVWLVVVFAVTAPIRAAEVMPPAPRDHFNDYAGVVSRPIAQQLEAELTQFERDSSNQLVVAIYPHMQSDSSIEDYTVRVAQAWGVGTKERKNGAVLFVFTQDRKLFIQVGYGLEGVLPDARCKQIVENEIKPRFRNGDYGGGVAAGVRAMIASVRGEYRGSGRTVREGRGANAEGVVKGGFVVFIIIVMIISAIVRRARGTVYTPRARRGIWVTPPWGGGGWGGGSGGGGGWSSGGGGGSFSGGGGSFGGGGAGGSW